MSSVIAAVATESGRSRARITADMVWASLRYQAGYLDYQEFEFYRLTGTERRTWITSGSANSIVVIHNQRDYRSQFSDKVLFNTRFQSYLGREWLDLRGADADRLAALVAASGAAMAKPLDGMSGAGVERIDVQSMGDPAHLHTRLIAERKFLVEGFIEQHPAMSELAPSSVNSLRIITFYDGTTVHVLEAVLRMGNGADVDNYGRGGMYTVIDERTGRAPYAAFDKWARTFEHHPISGRTIPGFQVPLYSQVLTMLDSAAREVPQIPYVGWDVAITESGPVIIEGNYNTGVFQMKPSITGVNTGLLARFRSVIDF